MKHHQPTLCCASTLSRGLFDLTPAYCWSQSCKYIQNGICYAVWVQYCTLLLLEQRDTMSISILTIRVIFCTFDIHSFWNFQEKYKLLRTICHLMNCWLIATNNYWKIKRVTAFSIKECQLIVQNWSLCITRYGPKCCVNVSTCYNELIATCAS